MKNALKTTLCILLVAALFVAVSACKKEEEKPVPSKPQLVAPTTKPSDPIETTPIYSRPDDEQGENPETGENGENEEPVTPENPDEGQGNQGGNQGGGRVTQSTCKWVARAVAKVAARAVLPAMTITPRKVPMTARA